MATFNIKSELLAAMEFGFRQAEKGHNLDHALIQFNEFYVPDKKSLEETREDAVLKVVNDGQWHTLTEIAEKTAYPECSVSCQLREFRKAPNFSIVEKRRVGKIWEYRLPGFEKKDLTTAPAPSTV